MQQPINNYLEKMMNDMKPLIENMEALTELWRTYEPVTAFDGATVQTMIGLLQISVAYLKEKAPDSQKPGAEGGNCK